MFNVNTRDTTTDGNNVYICLLGLTIDYIKINVKEGCQIFQILIKKDGKRNLNNKEKLE